MQSNETVVEKEEEGFEDEKKEIAKDEREDGSEEEGGEIFDEQ